MRTRILWNDLKGNPLISVTTWLFMAVSAFMFALTCFLSSGLLGSMDKLMEVARTPDFLQMHAGLIDETELGIFLKTLGATGFRFLINYKAVCGWVPAVAVISVFCAILLGISQMKHIRAYECCMGKE